jgi:hypothetical protein
MERLIIVPDEKEGPTSRLLAAKAAQIAGQITAQNLASVIGEIGLHLGVKQKAHSDAEIVLWGRADENFLAVWTSHLPVSEVVEVATCQGSSGLVAEVFATETSRSQAEPILQATVWTNLGDRRGRQITAMRGVPLSVFGHGVGVLTWVGYGEAEATAEDEISKLAVVFSRFSELKILKMLLAMEVDA